MGGDGEWVCSSHALLSAYCVTNPTAGKSQSGTHPLSAFKLNTNSTLNLLDIHPAHVGPQANSFPTPEHSLTCAACAHLPMAESWFVTMPTTVQ